VFLISMRSEDTGSISILRQTIKWAVGFPLAPKDLPPRTSLWTAIDRDAF